jgi:hypothetical protein
MTYRRQEWLFHTQTFSSWAKAPGPPEISLRGDTKLITIYTVSILSFPSPFQMPPQPAPKAASGKRKKKAKQIQFGPTFHTHFWERLTTFPLLWGPCLPLDPALPDVPELRALGSR